MRELEALRRRIAEAIAVGGLLAACTPESNKAAEAEAVDAAPRDKTKTEGRVEPVGVQTEIDRDSSCDPQIWCGSKELAAKVTVVKKPTSLGCPPEIAGPHQEALLSTPEYSGLSSAVTAHVEETATSRKRAEGDEVTCCYLWEPPCRGRPLIDRGRPVLADAWVGSSHRIASDVEVALAAMWVEDARAEQASVASFARVVLELLAVGAPAELVHASMHASADEVEHTRMCFAIASSLAGRSIGPGPLPALAPRSPDLARLAADTFVEGCVEETLAAYEAMRAAALCTSPSIRAALQRIAEDEARHAALAWRTVAWALGRESVQLDTPNPPALPREASHLDAHVLHAAGRLTAREQASARHDAFHGVVLPMLARLVHRA